ncbi:uncharacterized protein I303_106126 [Kwoniella dejecticola CBS 10117]|uniref:Uncharacterized protein n=1 Tax=Kwoniella dejecticola CBS 10117 TaxID=1296121 RepID=A0A1A6A1D2_9TREE|nr:uncharacterized protein I303_06145 [Kwoniella dejecticola CBS 10117]OBR83862.1 hypothetical protein I303_06145 [Kwoniella dejecticola CBS 10117]
MDSSDLSDIFDFDPADYPPFSPTSSHSFSPVSSVFENRSGRSPSFGEAGPSRPSPPPLPPSTETGFPDSPAFRRHRSNSESSSLPDLSPPVLDQDQAQPLADPRLRHNDPALRSPTTGIAPSLLTLRRVAQPRSDIQRTDERDSTAQIMDGGSGRPGLRQRQAPTGPGSASGPSSGSTVVPRRRSLIEIQDEDGSDSDDDIVFTGANINPNPPQAQVQPRQQVEQEGARRGNRPTRNGNGNGNGRGPSPNRFRRMMDEIDNLVQRRGEEHDAIINDQQDERRRAILSPPVPPEPPAHAPLHLRPRIGLGGGGLYRRGQAVGRQNPGAGAGADAARYQNFPNIDESEEDGELGLFGRLLAAERFGRGFDLRTATGDLRARLAGLDRGLGWNLGGLVGAQFGELGPGPGEGGAGWGRREEDVQTILSKIPTPKYPSAMKGFTMDFDMDNIVSKEPIELDDEGNIIQRNDNKKKKRPTLVCAGCSSTLLVSSAYKSEEDKLWVSRCGHMLDQKCLTRLQTPTTNSEILSIVKQPDNDLLDIDAAHPPKRRKNAKRKVKKVEIKEPDEYTFRCPVEGCGRAHKSVLVDERWRAKEGQGAIAAYA